MIQLCYQKIHYDFGRIYYKVSITENIKAINNKTEQNKAQYNLDRQAAKSYDLSSGNVSKYEFLTGRDVLPENYLLEKAAAIKRFEYGLLDKELKKQSSVAEKQYQKLDLIEFKDKIELFFDDAIEVKPKNEDQIEDLKKGKL